MNPSEESDAALLGEAAQGSRPAIEALVQRLWPDLNRFLKRRAGRLVLDQESGADLTQSVCREMLEGLASERFEYRGDAEFKQWLFRAAELKIKNRQRFYMRDCRAPDRQVALDGALLIQRLTSSSSSPSQVALRREELERLEQAFDQLDERSRTVTMLFHLRGLSHTAIAAELGIEVGHSRTLLARALARLSRLAT